MFEAWKFMNIFFLAFLQSSISILFGQHFGVNKSILLLRSFPSGVESILHRWVLLQILGPWTTFGPDLPDKEMGCVVNLDLESNWLLQWKVSQRKIQNCKAKDKDI